MQKESFTFSHPKKEQDNLLVTRFIQPWKQNVPCLKSCWESENFPNVSQAGSIDDNPAILFPILKLDSGLSRKALYPAFLFPKA